MKLRVVIPSRAMMFVVVAIGAVAAMVPLAPGLALVWRALLILVGLLVVVDFLVRPRRGGIAISRSYPALNHIGRESHYVLKLHNRSDRYLAVELRETLPPALEGEGTHVRMVLAPGREIQRRIPFVGLSRGEHALPEPRLRVAHPLGLLEYQEVVERDDRVNVVPGRPAGETEWLLARIAVMEESEVRRTRRRGSDREFESIREYVVGDELRRIDWKASARRFHPLVRQYQTERSVEVILALDCGRLMGNLVGGITKLDLAMTPLLDLAAVALRRKERVGFLAFDSGPRAFLPPRGGMKRLSGILGALAGLPGSEEPTSYLRAVRYLESRHRKRSLVLVFTDFTDEISAQEMEASLGALTHRHVVIFVGVSDTHLQEVFDASRTDAPSLFEKAVAGQLILERRRTIARMERRGIFAIDADPMRLTAPLIRKYLDVRLGGAL